MRLSCYLADTATVKDGATGYRLPTGEQWEYAARGGDPNGPDWDYIYAGTNSEDTLGDYAWYHYTPNNNNKTHDVKTKKPNAALLYDMSGNVWEWCYDPVGSERMLRGGHWNGDESYCEILFVGSHSPDEHETWYGFRVVLPAADE